jgi:hypothetical protein
MSVPTCYHSHMYPGYFLLANLILSVSGTSPQTLTLSAKYTLHADKQAHGRTVVALTRDQALITIIGNEGNWS